MVFDPVNPGVLCRILTPESSAEEYKGEIAETFGKLNDSDGSNKLVACL